MDSIKKVWSDKMEQAIGIRPWQIIRPFIRFGGWLKQCNNGIQQWSIWPIAARRVLLRAMGAKLHPTAIVVDQVYISDPSNLIMGEGTYLNVRSLVDGHALVTLGDWVRVGAYVRILTRTHEYNRFSVYRRRKTKDIDLPVTIERGCWIGNGSIIMPGVTIREGCVIGAHSLVLETTKPNCLYVGSPARLVRELEKGEYDGD